MPRFMRACSMSIVSLVVSCASAADERMWAHHPAYETVVARGVYERYDWLDGRTEWHERPRFVSDAVSPQRFIASASHAIWAYSLFRANADDALEAHGRRVWNGSLSTASMRHAHFLHGSEYWIVGHVVPVQDFGVEPAKLVTVAFPSGGTLQVPQDVGNARESIRLVEMLSASTGASIGLVADAHHPRSPGFFTVLKASSALTPKSRIETATAALMQARALATDTAHAIGATWSCVVTSQQVAIGIPDVHPPRGPVSASSSLRATPLTQLIWRDAQGGFRAWWWLNPDNGNACVVLDEAVFAELSKREWNPMSERK